MFPGLTERLLSVATFPTMLKNVLAMFGFILRRTFASHNPQFYFHDLNCLKFSFLLHARMQSHEQLVCVQQNLLHKCLIMRDDLHGFIVIFRNKDSV